MKISMNSWHYRWLSWMSLQPQYRTNVCAYVRGLVMATFLSFVMLTLCTLVLACMATTIFVLFVDTGDDLKAAAVLGMIFWAIAIIAGMCRVMDVVLMSRYERKKAAYLANHTLEEWYDHLYKEQEDGLFKRWWKDKSSKMCSFIQFT